MRRYGSSREAISSGVRCSESAATASWRWCGLVAPTIGAVIAGLLSSQASAIWARGTPRCSAICPKRSTTLRSASSVCAYRLLPELVGFIAFGAFGLPGAGQAAARERAPGNDADAFGLAKRNHLALFFAIEQVVMILHGNKTRPAVQVGEIERLGELPGVHGRGADVAHLARFHHVVQCLQSFLDRRFVIPAMNLVEVHIVGLQTAEALVEFEEDGFAGEAAAIGLVAHDAVDLGGDDHGFAAGVCFQESPEHLLAVAAGIDIGGVEEVDPEIERLAKKGLAFLFVKGPGVAAGLEFARGRRSVGHAAETDAGNFEAGLAEVDVVHYFSSTGIQILPPVHYLSSTSKMVEQIPLY